MSDTWVEEGAEHQEFSWGPEKRARPSGSSLTTGLLAVLIVAMLAAGVVGLVVQHKSTKTASPPAGTQRLADTADQVSLEVPPGWQSVTVSSPTLTAQLQSVQTSYPQMAPLVDAALRSRQKSQVGLFAFDPSTPAEVFSYGVATPGITKVSDIPASEFVNPLKAAGAQNVQATSVHLPLGDGERLSFRLAGTATVSEYLDYVLYQGRFVFVAVLAQGDAYPTALLHQIEGSLAAA